MSNELARRLREDRLMRDAARQLVEADISGLKADLGARGIASRATSRMSEGAAEVFDSASETAQNNRGVLLALLGAVVLWFARNPLRALFDEFLPATGGDTDETEPTDEDTDDG